MDQNVHHGGEYVRKHVKNTRIFHTISTPPYSSEWIASTVAETYVRFHPLALNDRAVVVPQHEECPSVVVDYTARESLPTVSTNLLMRVLVMLLI